MMTFHNFKLAVRKLADGRSFKVEVSEWEYYGNLREPGNNKPTNKSISYLAYVVLLDDTKPAIFVERDTPEAVIDYLTSALSTK